MSDREVCVHGVLMETTCDKCLEQYRRTMANFGAVKETSDRMMQAATEAVNEVVKELFEEFIGASASLVERWENRDKKLKELIERWKKEDHLSTDESLEMDPDEVDAAEDRMSRTEELQRILWESAT